VADIKHYLQIKKDIENKKTKNPNPSNSSNVVKGVFKDYNNSFNGKDDDDDDDGLHKKIHNHRIKIAIIIGICIIAFIAIAVIVAVSLDNIKYSGYTIIKSISKDDTEAAQYIDYNDGYIRYSNDGISCYTNKGEAIWNQTYQMKAPQVKICGKSLAIGDLNGSSIYIFNDKGFLYNVDTSLPISQIEVSIQGLAAAVLEDTNVNYIRLYNTDGSILYTVKTELAQNGYPLDISMSDDATKLVASYVLVNGDSIKTNVVFYSFSDVGENETEKVVGGFNQYDSTLVPKVKFINDTCAVAIGENVLSIYKIKEYPTLLKDIKVDSEIERVFMSDVYIGLVLKNSDAGDVYKMLVYNINGTQAFETTFNTEYNIIKFDGKSIIMYNDTTFTLMNINGKIQFEQSFDLPIKSILSLGSKGDYMLINSKYIQEIKLK